MPSNHSAIVVFGSGPGVGRNVAALFAERGIKKVVLLSRNASRLEEDADFVRKATGGEANVTVIPQDLSDVQSTQDGLKKVEEALEGLALECVLFNAARLGRSEFFSFKPEELESDLRIAVISLYAVTQWAIPALQATAAANCTTTPSFLVTSGMLGKDPAPPMFSLATCKAAQANLVHSLHKEFEPKNVHCGLIVIGGKVADESKVTNARNIAEETWKLFRQERKKGDLEVVMIDPAYAEHVKNRGK